MEKVKVWETQPMSTPMLLCFKETTIHVGLEILVAMAHAVVVAGFVDMGQPTAVLGVSLTAMLLPNVASMPKSQAHSVL